MGRPRPAGPGSTGPAGRRVWRPAPAARVCLTLVALFFLVGVLLPWEDGSTTFPPDGSGDYSRDAGYRALGVALAAGLLALAHRGRMELRQDTLVLRHVFTTHVIPLDTIVGVFPTDAGLVIETADGTGHGSPALVGERSPLAGWLGRRTRADEIADAVMAARPHG